MHFGRFFLSLLWVLLLVVPSVAAVDTSGQPSVRVQSVQADFIQEKHLKILVRPIFSSGRFVFQAPNSLRWEYLKPFRSILAMDKGRIRKFVEHGGRMVEDSSMRLDAMGMVLGEISGWLEGRFTDNAAFTAQVVNGKTIRLSPKQEAMRGFISSIVLKLGDTPGLLDTVTIYEGADSFTRLVFSDALLNQPVQEQLFIEP
jgi:hypothetical protein